MQSVPSQRRLASTGLVRRSRKHITFEMNNDTPKMLATLTMMLAGCTGLLQQDFDKATHIGKLQLGNNETFKRTLLLPTGSARIILAIPNYRCFPIEDKPITVVVRDKTQVKFSEHITLSRLTWSYGENSCDAYGYLTETGKSSLKSAANEMRLEISDSKTPFTVEIDATQLESSSPRTIDVWFIYGDRVPARKIFGDFNANIEKKTAP